MGEVQGPRGLPTGSLRMVSQLGWGSKSRGELGKQPLGLRSQSVGCSSRGNGAGTCYSSDFSLWKTGVPVPPGIGRGNGDPFRFRASVSRVPLVCPCWPQTQSWAGHGKGRVPSSTSPTLPLSAFGYPGVCGSSSPLWSRGAFSSQALPVFPELT